MKEPPSDVFEESLPEGSRADPEQWNKYLYPIHKYQEISK